MIQIEEDITGLSIGLAEVDQNVDFLFDEQVIQDERLFSLEQTSLDVLGELDSVEDELESEFEISLLTSYKAICIIILRLHTIFNSKKLKSKYHEYLSQIYRTQLLLWISGSQF